MGWGQVGDMRTPDKALPLVYAEWDQCPGEEHLQPDSTGHRAPIYYIPGQQGDQAAASRWAWVGLGWVRAGKEGQLPGLGVYSLCFQRLQQLSRSGLQRITVTIMI